MSEATDRWFVGLGARPAATVRLVAFPHAGSTGESSAGASLRGALTRDAPIRTGFPPPRRCICIQHLSGAARGAFLVLSCPLGATFTVPLDRC